VLGFLRSGAQEGEEKAVYADRKALYQRLEQQRESRVLVYVTGDRRGLETQISSEALDLFAHHLDLMDTAEKISLILYTRGGDTLASWSIANLVRQFCRHFEVIVPLKAHSGGTLICLGADNIVMTKQASLGPIDPSVNTPLNPEIPGAPPNQRFPVSVEAVTGFIEFAKRELGEGANPEKVLVQLAEKVHPLVLGQAYRARGQIRMLAKKLLGKHASDSSKIDRLLEFLCSESGSHDYTINRQEARDDLGLPIERPNQELYDLIKGVHSDIAAELELTAPFSPSVLLSTANPAQYKLRRALIESVEGGVHVFASEGVLRKQPVPIAPGIMKEGIQDERQFEGWRHENA
jgi:hypothetical protein